MLHLNSGFWHIFFFLQMGIFDEDRAVAQWIKRSLTIRIFGFESRSWHKAIFAMKFCSGEFRCEILCGKKEIVAAFDEDKPCNTELIACIQNLTIMDCCQRMGMCLCHAYIFNQLHDIVNYTQIASSSGSESTHQKQQVHRLHFSLWVGRQANNLSLEK